MHINSSLIVTHHKNLAKIYLSNYVHSIIEKINQFDGGKMHKLLTICSVCTAIFLFMFSMNLGAQNKGLYVPLNIQKSIDAGVRTNNGMPGPGYWQNHSDYKIKAELLPDSSALVGSETIVYHNESPDTLKQLVIRLYQDILKKGGVCEFPIGTAELTDGTDIKLLIVNDDTLKVGSRRDGAFISGTNMFVALKNPLPPKTNIKLKIDWQIHIPKIVTIRMGNFGDNDMFIAYWYPQMSVYDDIDGWDTINYSGFVEFYNDFSNFDFEITMPGNMVAWATGELQNPEEVFQQSVIDKINEAKQSDEKVNIISPQDYKDGRVTIDNPKNTWKFKANNVADVSFCVSDSYVWDASSVQVDNNGRRVLTNAVYEDSTVNWEHAAMFARTTIDYLSHELPGYPYPYPHTTNFCNKGPGGGMETPMMTNDGAPKEDARTLGLIFHEITHTLFPFFMGTNERKYAWMDEGWASFYLTETVENYPGGKGYKAHEVNGFESGAGDETELPMITPSFSYKGDYIRVAFYNKPASAYFELMELLGRDTFKKAMLEYMNRWNGKHPIPYDFFNTINDAAGEDLSWFWKPWWFDYGYPDLALKNVKQNGDNITAEVEKLGVIPTRVELKFVFDDGTNKIVKRSAREWKDKNSLMVELKSDKKLKEVQLGTPEIPDTKRDNNSVTL